MSSKRAKSKTREVLNMLKVDTHPGKNVCPKCGSRKWVALNTKTVKGKIKVTSCTDCPSYFEHH